MHTLTLATLFFLLQLSSFFELPNLISVVEASNGSVFKVDLIHLNSTFSNRYNSSSMTPPQRLNRSSLGSISRGHRNTTELSSVSYDLTIDSSGGYLIKIAIGTPRLEIYAIADTGSNLVWVQCTPCESCNSQKSPQLFDPTKSSTFRTIPCNTSACTHPDLPTTGCRIDDNTTCYYQYNYGSVFTSGTLAMETISLPSSNNATAISLSLPSLVFGCGMHQSGIIADGIIGLGTGPSSLVSQLGPIINYKFSYCLPPLNFGGTGKLTFGADVTGPGVVSTPFSVGIDSLFYNLTLDGIRVGDKDVSIPRGMDVIIDSGTTLTMLPTRIYHRVKTAIKNAIGLSTSPSPIEPYDLCYSVGRGQFNPPYVVFRFRGADIVLKTINTFRTFEQYGVTCLAMVATDHVAIFGNIAQVNFEVGYDLQAKQVSFAPADCTSDY